MGKIDESLTAGIALKDAESRCLELSDFIRYVATMLEVRTAEGLPEPPVDHELMCQIAYALGRLKGRLYAANHPR